MNSFKFLFFLVFLSVSSISLIAQESEELSNDIEEVVVTATSRETSIFEVPYNISAVSGNEIDSKGVQDTAELLRSFAGISTIDRGSRNAGTVNNIRIRGLNVDSNALQDYPVSAAASVSTYVDKTPVFANFLLKDLNRVEVLRGPQSTLYGSGSLGGTVRYITNKPVLGEFSSRVNLTASQVDGSDDLGNNVDVVINVPILSNVSYRLVTSKADYPGITDYVNVHETSNLPAFNPYGIGVIDESVGVPTLKNGFGTAFDFMTSPPVISGVKDADTVDLEFYRHKFLIDLSEKVELLITQTNQEDMIGGRRSPSTGVKYVLNESCVSLLAVDCYSASQFGDYENGAVMLEPSQRDVTLNSLELNVDGSRFDLEVSLSNYERQSESITDNTGFFANGGFLTGDIAGYYSDFGVGGIFGVPPRPYVSANRQYENNGNTFEARLVSEKSEKMDFVLGVFFQKDSLSRMQQTLIKGTNAWNGYYYGVDYVVDPLEKDFDYKVSETVRQKALYGEFTFHTSEVLDVTLGFRHFSLDAEGESDMTFALYGLTPSSGLHENKEQDTLYKLNLAYMPQNDQTWYATISEGFRRGGINAVPTEGTFIEEDGWVPFNADKVLNYELGRKGVTSNNIYYNLSFYKVVWKDPQLNTDTPNYSFYAVINGDEAETQGFDLELSGALGKFDWDFGYARNSSELTADLITPASTPAIYASNGTTLPGTPENMLNAGLAHTSYLDNGWGLVHRANIYHQSEMQNHLSSSTDYNQDLDAFSIGDISSTLFNDDMYISFFIKNITNERGVTGMFKSEAFGPDPSSGFYGSNDREFIALPRTIGISIDKSF
tara:strand:- start:12762 stop:15257 length:2496 start_codon:yes stop_codon:yes gene_type:complete